jgi:hypothetical protein
MRNTADVTDGKPIAVLLQSISGVSALVAFFDIHGGKRGAVFLFRPGNHTSRYLFIIFQLHGYITSSILEVTTCDSYGPQGILIKSEAFLQSMSSHSLVEHVAPSKI